MIVVITFLQITARSADDNTLRGMNDLFYVLVKEVWEFQFRSSTGGDSVQAREGFGVWPGDHLLS